MAKYKVRLSKEHGGKYYSTTVEAVDEKEAFLKTVKEAEDKGIKLPKSIWTHVEKL